MSFVLRDLKSLIFVLLAVQLCLPVSGPAYVYGYLNTNEAKHTGLVCAHGDNDTGHQSRDGHEQIPHCHELDAPCDISSGTVVKHSPLISLLCASYNGIFLKGYATPPDRPPQDYI